MTLLDRSIGPTARMGFDATIPAAIERLPSISLAELDAAASLQKRMDRKYIVTADQLEDLLQILAHRLAVLEIDGARSFGYESVYFDTVDRRSFLAAARKRRHRFKVRTRRYAHSGDVKLEVKTRDGRGATVKHRRSVPVNECDRLSEAAKSFVDESVGEPGLGAELRPELTTSYRRITLVDLDAVARITIDADLRFTDGSGRAAGLADRFVLETKSAGGASANDRALWRLGIRPTKISKFGTGSAVLDPTLPRNKWHRTIERHF